LSLGVGRSVVPVVHIGYSRAGAGWLQEVVFPRMRGVKSAWPDAVWRDLAWRLVAASDRTYFEETLRTFVEEFLARAGRCVALFSQEMISGDYRDPVRTMGRSAERLKRLFPDAKVLVVTRRQDRITLGLYGVYVRTGGHRPLRDLLEGRPIEGWRWDREFLEYDRLVDRYVELYGVGSVKVIPYELVQRDPRRFLDDLSEFCGADGYDEYETLAGRVVNASFSPPAALLLRGWNRLFVHSRFNSEPVLGARSAGLRAHQVLAERVDPLLRRFEWRWPSAGDAARLRELAASYAESNRRLQERTGYQLAELGYALSTDTATAPD
jgi:hypothetical protein